MNKKTFFKFATMEPKPIPFRVEDVKNNGEVHVDCITAVINKYGLVQVDFRTPNHKYVDYVRLVGDWCEFGNCLVVVVMHEEKKKPSMDIITKIFLDVESLGVLAVDNNEYIVTPLKHQYRITGIPRCFVLPEYCDYKLRLEQKEAL